MAFCDYSGIAYKIDVAASHARVVHLPTQYASFLFISIHSCGGVLSRHLPGKSSRGTCFVKRCLTNGPPCCTVAV